MRKWSRYNHIFKKNGICLIYNSLSNAFAELPEELYNKLRKYSSGDSVEIQDSELMEELIQLKVIVTDDDFEILKFRYQNLSHRFSHNVLALTINPTLGCNFACPYCFEGEHKTSPRMNDEIEDAIISFINRHKLAKVLDVTWFGGEPLLDFSRIKSLTTKMLALGLAYNASIITNGYLLTKNIIQEFERFKIGRVQITIDGPKELHDKRRYLKNGGATFDKILANLVNLSQLAPNIHIGIRVNLDLENKDEFISIYNTITQLQLKNVSIHPAFVKDHTGNCTTCALSSKEQYIYIKELYEKFHISFSRFYPSNDRYECGVRNPNAIVIGPSGELYKCWNDVGNKDKIYGSIFGEITNEKILLDYLIGADPFDDEKCRSCTLLPVCSGGCPYERLELWKRKTVNTCPLMKENIEEYLWFHYLSKKK